jgi:predicted nucleotide-binding protein
MLRVPLADAQAFLTGQLSEGRELAQFTARDEAAFDEVELKVGRWRDKVRTWLDVNLGGEGAKEFTDATMHYSFGSLGLAKETEYLRSYLASETSKLESIIDRLPLWMTPESPTASAAGSVLDASAPVFIVHGHDVDRAEVVARVVERNAGREAIILHEQPDAGRTIIEKLEDHGAAAAYAVVLLTPDDHGGPIDGESKPRGRQNVVFEMGYFFGSIGRARVCVLYDPSVELPSDVHGLLYVPFDPAGAWKTKLVAEMAHAGITAS